MDQPLTFSRIAAADLEAFERQKEKIVTAVTEHIFRDPELQAIPNDREKSRLARECVKIFTENLGATMKHDLPAALVDYLDWLRAFLRHRGFPITFIPRMIAGTRNAAHAFLENANSDEICTALRTLRALELEKSGDTAPSSPRSHSREVLA
ncbi:MAG: hypothetical protein RBU27_12185 [Bacteroidota bacterium]|jgi:hypothetical protein|nr:hypothetical protein [Bacteroidota bacterium]